MQLKTEGLSKKKKNRYGILLAVMITGTLCGITVGAFVSLTSDLPQIQALESFKPSAATRIFSADQKLLTELYVERRQPVPMADIPKPLITALLTTEDRRFYEHSGIDIRGITRAVVKNILRGRYSEGASTLTQQLAKTLFLTPRKSLVRKFREAVISLQIERRYTKDEILALYLNQVYLGSGAYGVAMAARIYFNKSVTDLTLSECALIAGLPQLPSRYSPLVNPERALKRRNLVLLQMRITGAIDETTYQKAVDEPITTATGQDSAVQAPYFISFIKPSIEDKVGENLIYKGGLTIYTTLRADLQAAAQTAVRKQLARLSERMRQNNITDPKPQAALIAVDVKTGGIIAMVGGTNVSQDRFNRAVTARRQPGSAFKPIVYAKAISSGYNQTQTLLDAPAVFTGGGKHNDWQPENFSGDYSGEVSMRWALAHSKNIPVVRLIEQLGPSAVVDFAHTLGISTPLHPNLSLALGTSEVTLLDLTAAYAVFANQGIYTAPYGITEIRDSEGKSLWQAKPEQRVAMSRVSAAIVTDMLQAVIQEGTGKAALSLRGPLAGKTGTTNQYKDALFVGYEPSTATGVWVGNDDATPLGTRETGARAALPVWIDFMQAVLNGLPPAYFDIPDGVRFMSVDKKTGEPAKSETLNGVRVLVQ